MSSIGSTSLFQASYAGSSYTANTTPFSVEEDSVEVSKISGDSVEISQEGKKQAEKLKKENEPQELSEDEEKQVEKLKDANREVIAHEMAHLSAAGSYAKGVSFEYERGPDGKRYAVAGEVGIDASTEDTPEKTIQKMRQVISAALAPAKPSGQDRSVASSASKQLQAAQSELAQENSEKMKENTESSKKDDVEFKVMESEKSESKPKEIGSMLDITG